VSDEVLDDLRARLTLTRPPLDEGNGDWSYGVPDSYLRELVAYWRDGYDWRKAEAAINAYEHYQVSVADVPVHFLRKPGRGPRPIPLILSHGWPWTFWHWSKVIDPLADPAVVRAPVGLTFVTYENPPGIHTADERVRAFKIGPQASWFNHVNVNAHDRGGHFIPWENPDAWVSDLRRTFHGRRP
jgi:hypothetical protein